MFRVLQVQIQADVFVGGVGACVGLAESHRRNGQAQVMYERVAGTRSADHRDNFHWRFLYLRGSIRNDFYERVVGICARRGFASEESYLYIAEALRIKMCAKFL